MENADRGSTNYGWVIVVIATLSLVVSNGLAIGGLPTFYKPIREEFVTIGAVDASWAETFIANGANVTFLMSGVFSVIGGVLVSRFPLRRLMAFGSIVLGVGIVLLSRSNSITTFYTARFLIGASLGFVGVAPCVVLVSKWFREKRGTALGITLTGTSLGGSVISLIAASLIPRFGWRNSLLLLSSLVFAVLLPLTLLLVRESPPVAGSKETNPAEGMSLIEALSLPLFWLFALCAALVFYPLFVTLQQFILYVQTPRIGITAETAAFGQSALFAIGVGGKFVAGWLSDRFRAAAIMSGFAGLMFLSSLVLLSLTASNALLFLLPFAIGYGGAWVMLQRLASELFGGRDIGKILGTITLVEVTGAAVGGRVTGYLADTNGGDYTYAFYVVTIAAGLAFLMTLAVYAMHDERRSAKA